MNETMRHENTRTSPSSPAAERMLSTETRLIQQLRRGDPEAGHQFVHDYYPDVYRYLLYLTGKRDLTEDLTQVSPPQQQCFLSYLLRPEDPSLQSLEELARGTLRVEYIQAGWFEWRVPGPAWLQWVVPMGAGRRVLRPPVRERSREAALQALRRVDPQIREAVLQAASQAEIASGTVTLGDDAQIAPTELDLQIAYIPDPASRRPLYWVNTQNIAYVAP